MSDTERSIAIAEASLEHARLSSEQQLRAYVSVELQGLAISVNGVFPDIEIYNRGQTPAYALKTCWTVVAAAEDLTPSAVDDYLQMGTNFDNAHFVLGPNHHQAITYQNIPFAVETARDIIGGQLKAYVVGRVDYRDAFGKARTTRFCHVYSGPNTGPNGGSYGQYGNTAD